jgi:thiamine-phosphate pyrophosphorylase
MIVLISPEEDIKNEMVILNQLFDAGLEFYHLRKPLKNIQEYSAYLNKIEVKYHNRIVVHEFHELINKYNLKGIHFQEKKRRDHIDNPGQYFKNLNMYGKTISSSFHEVEELENCEFEFDYHLLSPVFSSISKKGYKGKGFNVKNSDKLIIGMGGVDLSTISEIFKLGFKGIGVLGGVWNRQNPLQSFIDLKNKYTLIIN